MGARTGVAKSLDANNFYWGAPAKPHLDEKKIQVAMVRLPDAIKEIRSLKKRIEELENKLKISNNWSGGIFSGLLQQRLT